MAANSCSHACTIDLVRMYANFTLLLNVIDIVDCVAGKNNCSQICLEQPGGFNYTCLPGYVLQEDGISCEG